jgi:hypothetical protein
LQAWHCFFLLWTLDHVAPSTLSLPSQAARQRCHTVIMGGGRRMGSARERLYELRNNESLAAAIPMLHPGRRLRRAAHPWAGVGRPINAYRGGEVTRRGHRRGKRTPTRKKVIADMRRRHKGADATAVHDGGGGAKALELRVWGWEAIGAGDGGSRRGWLEGRLGRRQTGKDGGLRRAGRRGGPHTACRGWRRQAVGPAAETGALVEAVVGGGSDRRRKGWPEEKEG